MQQYRQGDVLVESVDASDRQIKALTPLTGPVTHFMVVLGEATGHSHALVGPVRVFQPWRPSVPMEPVIGVVRADSVVRLEHETHAPIALRPGTYRVRRQVWLPWPGKARRRVVGD